MSQGGDDYVEGLGSNDYFTYEATFDAGDQVIGGEGLNWLNLSDLAALKITGRMLTGVEGISVSSTIGKGAITLGREVTNENNFVSVVTSSNADYNIAFFATASMLDHALQATGRVSRFSGGGGRDYLGIWQDGDAIFNGGDGENRISFFNLKLGVTVDLSLTDRQAIGHGSVQLTNVQDITGTTEADTLRGSARTTSSSAPAATISCRAWTVTIILSSAATGSVRLRLTPMPMAGQASIRSILPRASMFTSCCSTVAIRTPARACTG